MSTTHRRAWLGVALLVGVLYLLIGRVFALPADHVRAWRIAAWLASGVAFAAHIAYEHFSLRNPPRLTALHTSLAVAVGAFALAVAGIIRYAASGSPVGPLWLLALVAWPAITAIPAFVAAFAAAAMLSLPWIRRGRLPIRRSNAPRWTPR